MTDNIEKEGIRRAIDRFQKEHPCHLTFDVTLFDNGTDFGVIQRAIDMVAKKCQEDADIHIICEMAKLYLEGVRPMVKPKQGCDASAREYRQTASWLQELKERREKESRQIPQDMTEEACEAFINLTKKVIEILPDIVASVTANMPEAIEQYIESKIRNGKEESK